MNKTIAPWWWLKIQQLLLLQGNDESSSISSLSFMLKNDNPSQSIFLMFAVTPLVLRVLSKSPLIITTLRDFNLLF